MCPRRASVCPVLPTRCRSCCSSGLAALSPRFPQRRPARALCPPCRCLLGTEGRGPETSCLLRRVCREKLARSSLPAASRRLPLLFRWLAPWPQLAAPLPAHGLGPSRWPSGMSHRSLLSSKCPTCKYNCEGQKQWDTERTYRCPGTQ